LRGLLIPESVGGRQSLRESVSGNVEDLQSTKDVRGRSPTRRGLWKRAKGYGRIKRGRVSDRGGMPRKTSESRGEILKVREGEPNR
jgi:hypothetical protein